MGMRGGWIGRSESWPGEGQGEAGTVVVDLAGHRKPGTRRNFEFRKMTFAELMRASPATERARVLGQGRGRGRVGGGGGRKVGEER